MSGTFLFLIHAHGSNESKLFDEFNEPVAHEPTIILRSETLTIQWEIHTTEWNYAYTHILHG